MTTVKIDVNTIRYESSFQAGTEAMGLWLWGMLHARRQSTGGVLSRALTTYAWGSENNEVLAARLVDAGLWRVRDDGDWQILHYDAKLGRVVLPRAFPRALHGVTAMARGAA